MDTAKVYYDVDGNERTIHQMVELEPGWAANKIQVGEAAIAENAKLKEENKALEEIRRIAESYVSAPPQVRGGVFRNLDKKLLALSGKRN